MDVFLFTAVCPMMVDPPENGWECAGRENVILSSTADEAEALVETDTGGLNGVGE